MFRQRPPPKPTYRPLSAEGPPHWAHGFCYLSRQRDLHFGANRRRPVDWRPVVLVIRYGSRLYVLPATSQPHPDFFHLLPDDCFQIRPPKDPPHDSYLYWVAETAEESLLVKLGVLPHPRRIQIMQWLRERIRARAGSNA